MSLKGKLFSFDLTFDFKVSEESSCDGMSKSKILALYDASMKYQEAHIVTPLESMPLLNLTLSIFHIC